MTTILINDVVHKSIYLLTLFVDIKDPCASSPCQNGGSCFPDGRSYTCECTESFTGALCQTGLYLLGQLTLQK